jgi:hypothetical protein
MAPKKPKSSLDTTKLVLVEWLDALAQGEWHEGKREDLKCKSVGFVVFEDDEQIELAGTITAGMCNNSITIPKKMLTKVKEIKLENKLSKTKRKTAPAMDSKAVVSECWRTHSYCGYKEVQIKSGHHQARPS